MIYYLPRILDSPLASRSLCKDLLHNEKSEGRDEILELTDQVQAVPKRSVICIGGHQHYTVYDPATDHIEFLTAGARSKQPTRRVGLGFG